MRYKQANTAKPDTEKIMNHETERRGNTDPAQNEGSAPKLPHERDESSSDQSDAQGPRQPGVKTPANVGQWAFEDLENGQVDTDRGGESQRIKEQQDQADPLKAPKP